MDPRFTIRRASWTLRVKLEVAGDDFRVVDHVTKAMRRAGIQPEEIEEFWEEAISAEDRDLLLICGRCSARVIEVRPSQFGIHRREWCRPAFCLGARYFLQHRQAQARQRQRSSRISVPERVLLFCVASGTDCKRAGITDALLTSMVIKGLIAREHLGAFDEVTCEIAPISKLPYHPDCRHVTFRASKNIGTDVRDPCPALGRDRLRCTPGRSPTGGFA